MEELLNVLKLENINYETGVLKDGYFYSVSEKNPKKNAIKIRAKENYILKIENKIKKYNIVLENKIEDSFYTEYDLKNANIKILIEHIVNSHILVPAVLLRDFMDNDKKLYYIDAKTRKILDGSVRKYNTKLGYYSKFFEKYLSDKYENKIGDIKAKIYKFMFENDNDESEKLIFYNLYNDIEALFKMSLFRNPDFIEEVNKESISSIFLKGGYTTEQIAFHFENQRIDLFTENKLFILKNNTSEGFVLSNNIFSSISLEGGYQSAIIPLHPKYAIVIVPNKLYDIKVKEYGVETYMMLDSISELRKINKSIASGSINIKSNVIGRKDDLLRFLESK